MLSADREFPTYKEYPNFYLIYDFTVLQLEYVFISLNLDSHLNSDLSSNLRFIIECIQYRKNQRDPHLH